MFQLLKELTWLLMSGEVIAVESDEGKKCEDDIT